MKTRSLKKVLLLIIILHLVVSNSSFAYSEVSNSEIKGVLTIDYEVNQSEEEIFVENVEQNCTIDDTDYEYVKFMKNDNEINHKKVEKTVELKNISTNDKKIIKNMVNEIYDYEDEENYIGQLNIVDIEVFAISNGTYEQIEQLDIPVSGLTTNDLSNIEKAIERDERTWYFINASWESDTLMAIDGHNIPSMYKGILHYATIGEYKNPDTFNAIVYYSGEVELSDPIYSYTVTYKEIEKIPEPEIEPEPIEEKKTNYIMPVVIVSSLGIVLVTVAVLIHKKKKQKEGGKR